MDFLLDEVLRNQPLDVQWFLLRTSITDRTSPALATAISDGDLTAADSSAMFEELIRTNLYVQHLDDDLTWYRYHPLFRDLLRHRLALELSADAVKACHLRASSWFAEHGYVDEAIRHAVMAGDLACAAQLVESFRYDAINRDDWVSVERWIEFLPDAVVRERPALLLTRIALAYMRGRTVSVRTMLRDVDALLERDRSEENLECRRMLMAERNLLFAVTLDPEISADDIEGLVDQALPDLNPLHCHARGTGYYLAGLMRYRRLGAEAAISYLQGCLVDDLSPGDIVPTEILLAQAHIHWATGNLHECERIAHYALQIATARPLPIDASWARVLIGKVRYELNDLPAAEQSFAAVVANHRRGHFHFTVEALVGLGMVRQALGNPAGAEAASSTMLGLVLENEAYDVLPIVEALQVRIALQQGRAEPVLQWLGGKGNGSPDDRRFVQILHLLARRTYPSPFSDDTVTELTEHLVQGVSSDTNRRDRLIVDALAGLQRLEAGETADQMVELRDRMRETVQFGFIRSLIDLRPVIDPLLHALRQDNEQWAETLLKTGDRAPSAASPHLSGGGQRQPHVLDVLTEREVDVLMCLSEHLSNQEIADRLFISPLTVKRHASNIYDKLGVNSRRQALVRANELGFIPTR